MRRKLICCAYIGLGLALCITVVALACTGPPRDSGIVSLFRYIPPKTLADTWSLVASSADLRDREMTAAEVTPTGVTVGVKPQPSVGDNILFRLDFTGDLPSNTRIESRLVPRKGPVLTNVAMAAGGTVEGQLPVLAEGPQRLEIVFRNHPDSLPELGSFNALKVAGDRFASTLSHTRALLAWAANEGGENALRGLSRRPFNLVREEYSRSSVLLLPEDTLTVALPARSLGSRLRLWATVSALAVGSDGDLRAEVLRGAQWCVYESWPAARLDSKRWCQLDGSTILPSDAKALRFVLNASSEAVVLGSPILIPSNVREDAAKNLILIDLDTMRADRLGCYGYQERSTSARLDSVLHHHGFHVFLRAHSPGPWTLPATAKLLTSRYLNVELPGTWPSEYATLAEVMQDNGYYCAGFTGGGVLELQGFEKGFHQYSWAEMATTRRELGKVEDVFPAARAWLKRTDLHRFFLFVHTYEPHGPYTRDTFCRGLPHGRLGDLTEGEPLLEGKGRRDTSGTHLTPQESLYVQAAYDGGVRMACEATADLLAVLDEKELWSRTVVVILSDHGEEFWEHSQVFADHQEGSLYGEILNVPFMLYDPSIASRGVHLVEEDVTTVDLVPTVADLMGLEVHDLCDGESLAPLLRDGTVTRKIPLLALTFPTTCRRADWPRRACLIANRRKYIEPLTILDSPCRNAYVYPPQQQLYLLDGDPREAADKAVQMEHLADSLRAVLEAGLARAARPQAHVGSEGPADEISSELRRQLEMLGYMAGPPTEKEGT